MLAVNPPTQMLLQYLEHCREHKDGVFTDPALHPYFMSLAVAQSIKMDTTTDEYKERALGTLENWSRMLVDQLTAVSMREIADCGKFAQDSNDKKAKKMASDLLDSMALIHAVFKSWSAAVDHEHIAEWIWNDGEARVAAGTAPDISAHVVEVETSKMSGLLDFLKQKIEEFQQMAEKETPPPKSAKAESCADEPSSKPPVTPADIMKMLFENAKKPSAN